MNNYTKHSIVTAHTTDGDILLFSDDKQIGKLNTAEDADELHGNLKSLINTADRHGVGEGLFLMGISTAILSVWGIIKGYLIMKQNAVPKYTEFEIGPKEG